MSEMPLATLGDSELQNDIVTLRTRFPDTRALYREVCGLLFFRYGVTPTANKLYSLVRKGSMSTPTEVLQQFWQEIRDKTRVRIEHPELPEAIKQVAAEAIGGIWQAASAAAAAELATLRSEARHQVDEAAIHRHHAEEAIEAARRETAAIQARLTEKEQSLRDLRDALNTERQAHAATTARLQESRVQREGLERQLTEARSQFTLELEHARQQVSLATERAASSERRALREIDHERASRQKSERLSEELRAELGATRSELKEMAIKHAEAAARQQEQLQGLTQRSQHSDLELKRLAGELVNLQARLAEAMRRAERAEAEVVVTRRLVAELKKIPAGKSSK